MIVLMQAWRRCAVTVVCLLMLAASVAGHDFSASESVLEIDGRTVRSTLSINLLEIHDVDLNGDERISYDELDRSIERLFAAIKEHYRIDAAGDPAQSVHADRSEIVDDHVLQINLRYTFSRPATAVVVTSTLDQLLGSTHQHVVSLKVDGAFRRAVLDAGHQSAEFDARRVTPGRLAAVFVALVGIAALIVYRRRSTRKGQRPEG